MSAPYAATASWKDVSLDALACFRREFQIYFPAALLASAFAYLCVYLLQSIQEKLIVTHSFQSAMEPGQLEIRRLFFALGTNSILSIQWWAVWLAFVFLLSSVAFRMLLKHQLNEATIGLGEAFRIVRNRRFGELMALSSLVGVGMALFNFFLVPLLLRPLLLLLFAL